MSKVRIRRRFHCKKSRYSFLWTTREKFYPRRLVDEQVLDAGLVTPYQVARYSVSDYLLFCQENAAFDLIALEDPYVLAEQNDRLLGYLRCYEEGIQVRGGILFIQKRYEKTFKYASWRTPHHKIEFKHCHYLDQGNGGNRELKRFVAKKRRRASKAEIQGQLNDWRNDAAT